MNVGDELTFGFTYTGSIHGYAFLDGDQDGTHDLNEPRLEGITVNLLSIDGGQLGTDITQPDGAFSFTELLPGIYTIEVTPTTEYIPSPPSSRSITIRSRESLVALTGQSNLPPDSPGIEVVVGSSLVFAFDEL